MGVSEPKIYGPPRWPYSTLCARVNNVIWRNFPGLSPQELYDALGAEGLEIVEVKQNEEK